MMLPWIFFFFFNLVIYFWEDEPKPKQATCEYILWHDINHQFLRVTLFFIYNFCIGTSNLTRILFNLLNLNQTIIFCWNYFQTNLNLLIKSNSNLIFDWAQLGSSVRLTTKPLEERQNDVVLICFFFKNEIRKHHLPITMNGKMTEKYNKKTKALSIINVIFLE